VVVVSSDLSRQFQWSDSATYLLTELMPSHHCQLLKPLRNYSLKLHQKIL